MRYLEWLFLLTHLIFSLADGDEGIVLSSVFYGFFIIYGWNLPVNRPMRFKQIYIWLAVSLIIAANFAGVSLNMLLYLYVAKSFFLIGNKQTVWTTTLSGIVWVASEYHSEIKELEQLGAVHFEPPFGVGNYSPQSILIFSVALYVAVSTFTIFFSSAIVAEHNSRKRAEALGEQVEIMAKNLERTRIARDIHDSLGHTLTDLDIQLKVAKKLRDRDPDKAHLAIDKASLLSGQCIEDVSRAIQTMRQSDFDLNRALSNLVEQISNERQVRIQWEVNLPQLSLFTSHQIYCIVKEGLINIRKHSQASQILFQGCSNNREIVLKLKDNGIGFNPQLIHGGFGLQGMVERVREMRGKLEINSVVGTGTEISVIIPR